MRMFLSFLFFFFVSASFASAAEEIDNTSHLPLPRFASLRSDEVNMRAGPGLRYPIEWVYKRRGLPVEITAEYDIWRRVRDPEGTEGWVSKTELVGKRSAVVIGGKQDLREDHNDEAVILAHLDEGAMGQILSCKKEWCRVKFGGIKGYLRKTGFWGAYPEELFD
ncbi:MAG: SH3 domain-containing protein [Bdellovibrionales bacterium]